MYMTDEQEQEYELLCEEYGDYVVDGIESLGYTFDDIVDIVTSGNYVIHNAFNHEELGYELLDNSGLLREIPSELVDYINYEEYGQDYAWKSDGTFVIDPKGNTVFLEVIY